MTTCHPKDFNCNELLLFQYLQLDVQRILVSLEDSVLTRTMVMSPACAAMDTVDGTVKKINHVRTPEDTEAEEASLNPLSISITEAINDSLHSSYLFRHLLL